MVHMYTTSPDVPRQVKARTQFKFKFSRFQGLEGYSYRDKHQDSALPGEFQDKKRYLSVPWEVSGLAEVCISFLGSFRTSRGVYQFPGESQD